MAPTPQNRPEFEVFNEIGVIEHHIRHEVSRRLPAGMSYPHFEVLMHLVREGDGQTPADLARDMLSGAAAMGALLQKMEAIGHVTVMADVKNPRRRRVRLSRAGHDAYRNVKQAMSWRTDTLREGFTEAEFRAALPFLRALRAFLTDVSAETAEPEVASPR